MRIFLDFDGTVVEHEYPQIGPYNPGAFEVIEKLQQQDHEIILNTYRADCNDGTLEEAIEYLLAAPNIAPFSHILSKKRHPSPWSWENHLASGIIFLDDICKGIPMRPTSSGNADMVNWQKVDLELRKFRLYE